MDIEAAAAPGRVDAFSDVVREIGASLAAGRLAVFCGAGISLISGLPLARQFVVEVLQALGFDPAYTKEIRERLPFEAFIETLRYDSDESALLKIFTLGAPNRNHMLLARLMKAGNLATICTVNFDELIERALQAEGLGAGSGYELTSRDEAFDSIAWRDTSRPRLVKIHGTVSDRAGMVITLRQVASSRLSAQRQSVVEQMFAAGPHSAVLILGYSASDAFDISPYVELLAARGKRIFMVDHQQDASCVERIPADSKSPFRSFPHAFLVSCNTDRLIDTLWTHALQEPPPSPAPASPDRWRDLVKQWAAQFEGAPAARLELQGKLLSAISHWAEAVACFDRAIAAAEGTHEARRLANYYSNAGIAHFHLGKYEQAIKHHEAGIALARANNDADSEAPNLQSLANIHEKRGDPQGALPHYRRAAELARQSRNADGVAATSAALARVEAILGNPAQAVENLEAALQFARHNGLAQAEARIGADLGSMLFQQQRLAEALKYYTASLKLAEMLGVTETQGRVLANIGLIYGTVWENEKAIDYLQRSLVMARVSARRDRESEALALGGLGLAFETLKRFDEAVRSYTQSQQIGVELGVQGIVRRATAGLERIARGTPVTPPPGAAEASASRMNGLSPWPRPPQPLLDALTAELMRVAYYTKHLFWFDLGYFAVIAVLFWERAALDRWVFAVLGAASVVAAASAFAAARRCPAWSRQIYSLSASAGLTTGPGQVQVLALLLKATGFLALIVTGFCLVLIW